MPFLRQRLDSWSFRTRRDPDSSSSSPHTYLFLLAVMNVETVSACFEMAHLTDGSNRKQLIRLSVRLAVRPRKITCDTNVFTTIRSLLLTLLFLLCCSSFRYGIKIHLLNIRIAPVRPCVRRRKISCDLRALTTAQSLLLY